MPNPKPPDPIETCIEAANEIRFFSYATVNAARAELATLRADAKKWREHERNPAACGRAFVAESMSQIFKKDTDHDDS